MSDHYSILGLTKTATTAEIKTAYRRLVKIYHPDKNPNNYDAVEKFRKIQEAYETLMDPIKRSKYDGKISYNEYFSQQGKQQQQKSRTKKYSFTDEDLKKRQYYKQHYNQQHNQQKKANTAEEKKRYNETRYILASIPLAMALLFFIINVYERRDTKNTSLKQSPLLVKKDSTKSITEQKKKVSTAETPYDYFFTNLKIDRQAQQTVQVTNFSGNDAIVCIVDAATSKVIRHCYIENDFFVYFEWLPEGKYYLKNYLGTSFDLDKRVDSLGITGVFKNEKQFQSFPEKTFEINFSKHDTITYDVLLIKNNKRKNIISPQEFFTR